MRVTVDCDANALAALDMFDLGFLEVRDDPDIVDRNDIEQGRARRDKAAKADLAIADHAVDGRTYDGVVEIDLGKIARGLCLLHGGNGSFALTGKNCDALLLGVHGCGRRRNACLSSRERGVGFIERGLTDGIGADQLAAAIGGFCSQIHLGDA